jgi:uncharacterized phage infection (PIP) family protein YhgE
MNFNFQGLNKALLPILILGTMGTAYGQGAPAPTPAPTPDKMATLQKTADGIQASVDAVSAKVEASEQQIQQVQNLVAELKSLTSGGFSEISQKADQIQSALNGAVSSLAGLTALASNIQSQVSQLQSGVSDLQTRLAATAATLNQLKNQVGENEARLIAREIEDQLRTNKYELKLYIPASQNGQLDLVRDIVSTAYDNTASGTNGDDSKWYLDNAKGHLDKAIDAYGNGVWGKALDQFGKAYRDLVKANHLTRP